MMRDVSHRNKQFSLVFGGIVFCCRLLPHPSLPRPSSRSPLTKRTKPNRSNFDWIQYCQHSSMCGTVIETGLHLPLMWIDSFQSGNNVGLDSFPKNAIFHATTIDWTKPMELRHLSSSTETTMHCFVRLLKVPFSKICWLNWGWVNLRSGRYAR